MTAKKKEAQPEVTESPKTSLSVHEQIAYKHAKLADITRLRSEAQAKLDELLQAASMIEKVRYSINDMDEDIERLQSAITELERQLPPAP